MNVYDMKIAGVPGDWGDTVNTRVPAGAAGLGKGPRHRARRARRHGGRQGRAGVRDGQHLARQLGVSFASILLDMDLEAGINWGWSGRTAAVKGSKGR